MTIDDLQKIFSKRIKRKLVSLGIDQRELAKRAGISEVSLSRYMSGYRKPTYDIIIRIAQALHCSPGELIDINEILE